MENPFETINQRLDAIEKLLFEIKNGMMVEKTPTDNPNEFMNIEQVAEYLSLSVPTIYALVHKMEIPNFKRAKRLYFKKSEIYEWISQSKRKTVAEIQQETADYLARSRKRKY